MQTFNYLRTDLTPPLLALEFSKILHEWLTPQQMNLVVSRNAKPENTGCCASHDFCDANVAMDDAFKRLTGVAASDTGHDANGPADDTWNTGGCMSDQCHELWQAAWNLAMRCQFDTRVLERSCQLKKLYPVKQLSNL